MKFKEKFVLSIKYSNKYSNFGHFVYFYILQAL